MVQLRHQQMKREIPNRRPWVNTRTENVHFSVSFDPHTGHPVEFFITGRGKVGQHSTPNCMNSALKRRNSCKESSKMICPECHQGMIVALAVKGLPDPLRERLILSEPERYLKKTPCPRCNGSGIAYCCDGEDASQPDVSAGDTSSTGEAQPLVA